MDTKREIFYKAFSGRDRSFEGIFITAVKTTGIFCRPTCPARPKMENVEFFATVTDALLNGYRACKICKPTEETGGSPPDINRLLRFMEDHPSVEINETDIKKLGLEPEQVNRWTLENYQLTFEAFQQIYRTDKVFQPQPAENKENEFDCRLLNGFNHRFGKTTGGRKAISITRIGTKVGGMMAGTTDKGICLLEFADSRKLEAELKQLITLYNAPLAEHDHAHFDMLRDQLEGYFEGKVQEFTIPLDLAGTDFQLQAWLGLLNIPYGTTTTYAKQAEALGKPSAVRAIANANGKNRISIILPCHRIIGADGNLTGYGGGIWRKKKLLELEQNNR